MIHTLCIHIYIYIYLFKKIQTLQFKNLKNIIYMAFKKKERFKERLMYKDCKILILLNYSGINFIAIVLCTSLVYYRQELIASAKLDKRVRECYEYVRNGENTQNHSILFSFLSLFSPFF